jgi:ABC-2 type transport system permease protein
VNAFLTKWSYELAAKTSPGVALPPMFEDGITNGLSLFNGGNTMLFMAIIISLFVASEYSHGTMKNLVSKGFSKHHIYFSKIITMVTASYILLLLMFLSGTVSGAIVAGQLGAINGNVFMLLGVQFLLHTAVVSFIVLISNVARNSGGAVAVNVALSMLPVGLLLYQALEMLFRNKIRFTEFSLAYNISIFSPHISIAGSDILRAVIVSVVVFAVTTALGITAFRKMDVK